MFCLKLLCVSALMLVVSVQAPQHLMLMGNSQKDERTRRQANEVENAISPDPAICMPELRVIRLNTSDDLSLEYFPSCTRIEKCGGCCNNDEIYECKPIERKTVYFKVLVRKFAGANKWETRHEVIPVEKHLSCRCGCRLTPEHCTRRQEYNKTSCSCECANLEEKQKCYEDSNLKSWNHFTCTCDCKNKEECSSGYIFDSQTCGCVLQKRRIEKARTSSSNGR